MADQFKYVIQTELKLAPGAVSKLLRDIKTVDNLIAQQNIGNISLNARLSATSISAIQKEIGNMKHDILLSAKLDKASIANFKKELAVLVDGAKKDISISTSASNPSNPSNPISARRVPTRQLGSNAGNQQASVNDTNLNNLIARSDQRLRALSNHIMSRLGSNHDVRTIIAKKRQQEVAQERLDRASANHVSARLGSGHSVSVINARRKAQEREQEKLDRAAANNVSTKLGSGHTINAIYAKLKEREREQERLERAAANSVSTRLGSGHSVSVINARKKVQERDQEKLDRAVANNVSTTLGSGHKVRIIQNRLKAEERQQEAIEKAMANGRATKLGSGHQAVIIQARKKAQDKEQEAINKAVANGTAVRLGSGHQAMIIQAKLKAAEKEQAAISKAVANGTAVKLGSGHKAMIIQAKIKADEKNQEAVDKAIANGTSRRLGSNHQAVIIQARAAKAKKEQEDLDKAIANHTYSNLGRNHDAVVMQRKNRKIGSSVDGVEIPSHIKSLESKLLENNVPMKQKALIIKQLTEEYRNLARVSGQNINKSFLFTDEAGTQIRTTTKEFSKLGSVIDRGDKSLNAMAATVARNTAIYSAMTAAFAGVAAGIFGAVNAMAEFESQFLKIQNITASRREDKELDPKNFDDKKIKNDIFGLGKRYGLNPINDIMPIYSDIIRRKNLAGQGSQDALPLTQLVIRAGRVAKGGDVSGQDFQGIGNDFITVYQQMFDIWNKDGKNAISMMSQYVDVLATMSKSDVRIDKTLDSMTDLVPFSTGNGNVDLNYLTALSGVAQQVMGDSSGAEIGNSLKLFLTNLTASGESSEKARNILGVSNGISLQDALLVMTERVSGDGKYGKQFTDSQIEELAISLSGASGKGAARNAEYQKVIKQLPSAKGLFEEIQEADKNGTLQGSAEKYAISNAKTLKGEYERLTASLQELSVTLGDSGVKGLLVSITKTLTLVTQGINGMVEGISSIGKVTKKIFGEDFGSSINSAVSQLLVLTLAIKGVQFAYSKMFLGGGFSGVFGRGTTAAGTIAAETALGAIGAGGRSLPSKVKNGNRVVNALGNSSWMIHTNKPDTATMKYNRLVTPDTTGFGKYVGIPHRANPTPIASTIATATKTTSVGSRMGSILNGILSFASFGLMGKGGASAVSAAGTASTATNVSKVGTMFKSLITPLKGFAMLLGRLSIWGAALGTAFWIGKKIYTEIQNTKDRKADATAKLFSSEIPKGAKEAPIEITKRNASELNDILSYGMPEGFSEKEARRYRGLRRGYLENARTQAHTGGVDTWNKGTGQNESEEHFNQAVKAYAEKSAYFTGSGMASNDDGTFNFSFVDQIGDRKDKALFDTSNPDQTAQLFEASAQGIGTLSIKYQELHKNALDYSKILQDIAESTKTMDKALNYTQLSSTLNQIKFQGATDSSSFIASEMNSITTSMSVLNGEYAKLSGYQAQLESQKSATEFRISQHTDELVKISGNDKKTELDSEFATAVQGGEEDIRKLVSKYDVLAQSSEASDKDTAIYNYIRSIADKQNESTSTAKIEEEFNRLNQTVAQNIQRMKELHTQYLVAASGVNVFEAAIKRVNSSIGDAQSKFNIAGSNATKQSAMADVFSSMAQEAKLQAEQVGAIQATINKYKTENPDQDFSLSALYNPSEKGLTDEQGAVIDLTNKLYDAKSAQNASLESLKQQVDVMKELVMSSDKYASMWESVNSRIELSKQLASQIRDINSDGAIVEDMASLKSLMGGGNFNKGEYLSEQANSRKDNFISVTEQIKKSLVTYGDDAGKLKQALSEINGSYTDKIKSAFLEPLQNIVDVGFQASADKQLQAADIMFSSMSTLETILKTNLKALQDKIAEMNGQVIPTDTATETATESPKAVDTSTASGRLSLGLGPISSSYADKLSPSVNGTSNPFGLILPPTVNKITSNVLESANKAANLKPIVAEPVVAQEKPVAPAVVKDAVTDGNNGVSGVSWQELTNKSLKIQTNVTAEELDAFIASKTSKNSKMRGMGAAFVKAAEQSGLDPIYLMSHAAHETAWGTSNISKKKNNFYGIGAVDSDPYDGAKRYASTEEGIIEGANWISRNYANGNYGQDTLNEMRFNNGNHQYATDEGWANKIAQIMAGFSKNAVSGTESVILPPAAAGGTAPSFEDTSAEDNAKARDLAIQYTKDTARGAFLNNLSGLMMQKDIIKTNQSTEMSDFISKMGINGQGKFDLRSQESESVKESRLKIVDAIKANQDFVKELPSYLAELSATANDKSKSAEDREVASAQLQELNSLLADGKLIASLNKNTDHLKLLEKRYAEIAAKDPTKNATTAAAQISSQQQLIAEVNRKGRTGSVQYYDALSDSNQMYSNYMTTEKKTAIVQEHFDNTGNEYGQLAKLKGIGFDENVGLIFKQMSAVSKILAGLTSGTNDWHAVLEDAVALQEKIVELENKKTETAKRYFELTSQGVYAYINARAFTQNRDVRRANDNQKVMTDKYNGSYRSNPSASYTEGLVSLQAISEAYDTVQRQIEDYRNGVVGAFRAGVLSLNEYIKKMNELRNVQEESRNQALEMKSSVESTFQNSLSGALKTGFEGGSDTQGEFLKNIKGGISGTIADQMSTVVLSQSGLMDSVNNIIGKLVGQMTTGNPNDAANLFNSMDLSKLLDTELAKFLPLIQQITDSTKGMFNIMKDEVYNAPDGFKVDSALYEMQKPLKYSDVMSQIPSRNTNEAGAPNTLPNSTPSNPIVLPPTTTSIGNGIGNVIGEVVRPIESVGNGSTATPLNTKTVNPVEAILKGIISMKDLYNDDELGQNGKANQLLNNEAEKLREQLKVLAPEIASQIGDGKTGMSLEKMTKLLANQDLSAYEMSIGIDGVNGGIGALKDLTSEKLDSMIGGINGVITAVGAMRSTNGIIDTPVAGSGSTVSGGSVETGGYVSGIPSSGLSDAPVASLGNNGVGTSSQIKDNINKVKSDAAFRDAEKLRAQQVIDVRKAAGLSTSEQEKYLENLSKYHTGGIAGIMNFSSPNGLKANEIQAILQTGEPILQGGQIGDFANHFMSNGSSGNNSAIEINVNINGNASGMDEGMIREAITDGVRQGMSQMNRQARLNNLGSRGVSY